jgi:hypothetical protein
MLKLKGRGTPWHLRKSTRAQLTDLLNILGRIFQTPKPYPGYATVQVVVVVAATGG